MAVTAHWIESRTVLTAEGPVTNLVLRADLITFHNVPGRHTGEHLAGAFWHVLEWIGITRKASIVPPVYSSNCDLGLHLKLNLLVGLDNP